MAFKEIAELFGDLGVAGILAISLVWLAIHVSDRKRNGKPLKCNINNEALNLHFEKLNVILDNSNSILQRLTDKVDRIHTEVKEIKNSERAA